MATTSLLLPDTFVTALTHGADCGIGLSGGKDSQALLFTFVRWFRAHHFPGRLFGIHAHFGRAERTETLDFIRALCVGMALLLEVVRPVVGGSEGDLLDGFRQRREKLAGTDTPFWPIRGQRYCTSMKRDACNKAFRAFSWSRALKGYVQARARSGPRSSLSMCASPLLGRATRRLLPPMR